MTAFPRARFWILALVLSLWCGALLARLVDVQIVRGSDYRLRAQRQQRRTILILPRRGAIFDRDGHELAVSIEASSVYAIPDEVHDARKTARVLSRLLGLPVSEIEKSLTADSDRDLVCVARKIDEAAAHEIERARLAGIRLLPDTRRFYPKESLAANVLGYVGIDDQGLAGLEYAYDETVRGKPGELTVLRDARSGTYGIVPVDGHTMVPGASLVTTLDEGLQYMVEKELGSAVAAFHARGASAVILDPSNGDVLAMASAPTFDPNDYREFSPDAWRNRAIADCYEPGSVFKIITSALAIDAGVTRPDEPIDCGQGSIEVAGVTIHEAEHERFGVIPLADVMAYSSNVGIIRVGLRLGATRLYRGGRLFGLGRPTGIDLPGESSGIFRDLSRWTALSTATISMGQEVAVTPLQLAVAVATIANGGERPTPRVVSRIVEADGAQHIQPNKPLIPVVSRATAATVTAMMMGVVTRGTGERAAVPGYVVAGKTGTAQKAVGRGYSPDRHIASFAGFVPAEHPRAAIVVMIDEPKGEYYAADVAAPLWSRIAQRAAAILNMPPSGSAVAAPAPFPVAGVVPRFAPGVEPAAIRSSAPAPAVDAAGLMPDLHGLSARAALAELSRRGAVVELSGSGFVVAEQPASGSPIRPGDHVRLRLAPDGAALSDRSVER
jgi:cell division protein FtsI (penicillin-binding protein 3)